MIGEPKMPTSSQGEKSPGEEEFLRKRESKKELLKKIGNVGEYEREKIENTLKDARHLVAVIENYLEMVKFCDENEIYIEKRTDLGHLRAPNGIADQLQKISIIFEKGQYEIRDSITQGESDRIYTERIKPREDALKIIS